MSVSNYDEDICENIFFSALQNNKDIFDKATSNGWIICIPRASSLKKSDDVLVGDIEDHLIIPAGDDNYQTFSGKKLAIQDSNIVTSADFCVIQSVPILFEEVFYNANDESYPVYCVDRPLNVTLDEVMSYARAPGCDKPPSTYEECLSLLWPDPATSRKSQDGMNKLLTSFWNSYSRLQNENLRCLMDAANAQFTQAMKTALKDSVLRDKVRSSPGFLDNIKISVETYMMHFLHNKLFSSITLCLAVEDSLLNKTTRGLNKLQLRDLSVKQQFCDNIPLARREIARLNRYSTPLGKLFCVRRVVRAIVRPSSRHSSSHSSLTTDDFLPILMFLIVKSQIANWHANLVYMKHFNFAKASNADEHGYYLASIEGALEHILSGQLKDLVSFSDTLKRNKQSSLHQTANILAKLTNTDHSAEHSSQLSPTEALFHSIHEGNTEAIHSLLKRRTPKHSTPQPQLCHPLCSCDRCEMLQKSSRSDPSTVTVYSRDDRGYTVLHAAAMAGHAVLVDMLVKNGAVVNASDYMGSTPLHVAAEKGLQDFMLLLLYYRADPNIRDNDGNTPLHIATSYGHEDCVKALVFYDLHGIRADVDPCNDMGDTPLHLAAKWGYESIVKVLLENGAHIEVFNRKRETPYKVAANALIQRVLTEFVMYEAPVFIDFAVKKSAKAARKNSGQAPTQPLSSAPHIHPDTAAHINHEKKVERLLRAVANNDIQLVKFYLGWQEEWDEEEIGAAPPAPELCHPLCQCHRCSPRHRCIKPQSDGIHVDSYRNSDYMTPLHAAVAHGHVDMATFLINIYADVNCQTKKQQITPLHIAAIEGNTEMIRVLIEGKAKLNMRDLHGNTALHVCCANSNLAGVRCLLDAKANPNLVNSKGNTPLHEAVMRNRADIVDLLLESGSDGEVPNKAGTSALMLSQTPAMYKKILNYRTGVSAPDHSAIVTVHPTNDSTPEISIQDLFAAFEEKDLATLRSLGEAIRSFDKARTLRHCSMNSSYNSSGASRGDYSVVDSQSDDQINHDESISLDASYGEQAHGRTGFIDGTAGHNYPDGKDSSIFGPDHHSEIYASYRKNPDKIKDTQTRDSKDVLMCH